MLLQALNLFHKTDCIAKIQYAYREGEKVTRRDEYEGRDRVERTYYICCIKVRHGVVYYRLKETPFGQNYVAWVKEANLKRLW